MRGRGAKRKFKTSVTFFVCLGLKRAEELFDGYYFFVENVYFSVETMRGRGLKNHINQVYELILIILISNENYVKMYVL